jgi:hypothetical protein
MKSPRFQNGLCNRRPKQNSVLREKNKGAVIEIKGAHVKKAYGGAGGCWFEGPWPIGKNWAGGVE